MCNNQLQMSEKDKNELRAMVKQVITRITRMQKECRVIKLELSRQIIQEQAAAYAVNCNSLKSIYYGN